MESKKGGRGGVGRLSLGDRGREDLWTNERESHEIAEDWTEQGRAQ